MNDKTDSKFISVNMTDNIKIKLTEKGREHIFYHGDYGLTLTECDGGFTMMQFWVFLQIFGDISKIGMDKYYENVFQFQPGTFS